MYCIENAPCKFSTVKVLYLPAPIIAWRSDREAEGARLLSEYAPQGHLGFESLLLRQNLVGPCNSGDLFFFGNLAGIRTDEVENRQENVPVARF